MVVIGAFAGTDWLNFWSAWQTLKAFKPPSLNGLGVWLTHHTKAEHGLSLAHRP